MVSSLAFRQQRSFDTIVRKPMKYQWQDAGEEWSERWGTSQAQWSGTILPRIQHLLPAPTILEIGPGYGRWTRYLKDHCQRLLIVDRAGECIDACHNRFRTEPKITGYVNQGGSLEMIPDRSIDLVFSFDVFVHIRREIVEQYMAELARTMKIGAGGFIHHSNLGQYANSPRRHLPGLARKVLTKWHVLDEDHHRIPTMSADLFRQLGGQHGLHCLKQELVNWRGRRLIDCFSWFERSDSADPRATEIIRNPNFMREAEAVRQRVEVASASSR